jgi:predicted amidophosphoribosyltransferase
MIQGVHFEGGVVKCCKKCNTPNLKFNKYCKVCGYELNKTKR